MAVLKMLLQARRFSRGHVGSVVRTVVRTVARTVALTAVLGLGLVACGGGDDPPAQVPAAKIEMTGVSTDGAQVFTGDVSAKGATGLLRTNVSIPGTAYAVNMTDLTPPYMLQGLQPTTGADGSNVSARAASVATALGMANVTPLTDLIVQVMFAQPSATTFGGFGPQAPDLIAQVTDANIGAAQAQVVAFLRDRVGVVVPNPTASFITTPFQPVAGDPMFDTLVALRARQAALGASAYQALVDNLLQQIRLCRSEKLSLDLAGTAAEFCPASRTATPEDADSTIVAYTFTSLAGDVLSVRARDAAVLTASYVGADARRYDCSGAGCAGLTLGTPAADLTRPLVFANLSLAGSSGTAVFNGSLRSAIPGVALPNLPCNDNRFFLIEANRNVIADCLDTSEAQGLFGVSGAVATLQGTTEFAEVVFRSVLPDRPTAVTDVAVTLNGNAVASVAVRRRPFDPDTFEFLPGTVEYKCRGAACAGVTVGPATVNDSAGFPATVREVRFDNAVLPLVLADGSLSTDATTAASLRGAVTTITYSPSDAGSFNPVFPADCAAATEQLLLAPADESNVYASCDPSGAANSVPVATEPNGDLSLLFQPDNTQLRVTLDGNTLAVKEVLATYGGINEVFGCRGPCTGVSVSAPDSNGVRTVSLTNVPLRALEFDGFYTGDRTATLNGSFTSPPPPPATP